MNTKQFQYVLTLARAGSFSKAAGTLGISQPSLSQYVKKIEKEIGLDLFERANGYVKLTDAGHIYIDAGRKILDLEHQMENAFTDLEKNKTGSLTIGTAPYRAASMMPLIARAFQSLHPGMHLIVREGTTAELTEGMEHGEYDLAITLFPIDERQFLWEQVVEEEIVLAVPSSYPPLSATVIPNRKYPAIDPKSMSGKNMVMITDTQYMQKQLDNLLYDYKVDVRIAAVVKSLEAQIEMVKAGVGMALVPSGIERFCTDSTVRFYSFAPFLNKRKVIVMWRKDRNLSMATEELKEIICSLQW